MTCIIKPVSGYTSNPMKDFPRNTTCFMCNSGKKIKKCCGKHDFIPEDVAQKMREVLNGVDPKLLEVLRNANSTYDTEWPNKERK